MSAHRHPCVGDLTYGADPTMAKRLGLTRQWLHAVRLGFEHPGTGEWLELTSDYPEDDILKIAAKKKCDLIVMGTHGQGGLRGVFVGSVTQKVLAKAKIPVMVVR